MKRFQRTKFQRPIRLTKPRGLTMYYYGDGKGKTTAAVGLAVRARGAGKRVAFLQFVKSTKWPSFERQSLKKLGVTVKVLGSGFVGIIDDTHPLSWHKRHAQKALAEAKRLLRSNRYDVVVADEAVSAVEEKLLTQKEILALINAKPENTHLVLTGHNAYSGIIRACDLVTTMKNVKHPYKTEGMLAQKGIDW